MAINADTAARIAKERGLSLQDAATLAEIATDADNAAALADEFSGKGQLSRADLQNMTPEDVAAARKAGRLNDVLRGHDVHTPYDPQPGSDYRRERAS